jgi:hypothetical protein
MVLWDGITGVAGMNWLRGRSRDFLIARPGPAWDNPEMRAGGYGPVVMAAMFCQAGGEPVRWS